MTDDTRPDDARPEDLQPEARAPRSGPEPHVPAAWQPELPKLGGALGEAAEDFEVDELPLYEPSGAGAHWYLWVEKRGMNTRDVVLRLAAAAGVPDQEIGSAGLKDRHAITRQWISVPVQATEPSSWQLPAEVKILTVTKHTNKLRTGHLLGNRFKVRLVGCHADWQQRWPALQAALSQHGFYNYFGLQRFGAFGQNLGRAQFWIKRGAKGRGFQPRLYASVLQSEAFNRYLSRRRELGFEAPLLGEVVRLEGTGKHFRIDDVNDPRWSARDVHPTGPMAGPKMLAASDAALELERRVIAELGLDDTPRAFAKLAPGTRRDLLVFPQDLQLEADADAARLSFSLPSGSYATELISALTGAQARVAPPPPAAAPSPE